MHRTRRPSPRAFTLVEALATISILALVSLAASRIIFAASDAYAASAVRAELSQDLSSAMERIAAEFRSIPYQNASPGVPQISSATGTSISYGVDSGLQAVGGVLSLRSGGGPARTLLTDVTAFTLACFDEANQLLPLPLSGSACDAVRRIEVSITRTRNGASETLRSKIFLRCAIAGGAS
jgi:prepilin-type N-terminal cleavage/methylation domain-containing protein